MLRSITEDIKYQFRSGGALTRILIANVAVFLAYNVLFRLVLLIVGYHGSEIDRIQFEAELWLGVPYDPAMLITRPWTLFTCLFIHAGFSHLFWNMLNLYWFGTILNEFTKNRFGIIYFTGGIFSVAISWLFCLIFPGWYGGAIYMIGASGAVMAIIAAAATLVPDYKVNLIFIGPVAIKYLALVMIILDLMSVTYFSNTGGHIAHLGGALFGFAYITAMKRGVRMPSRGNKLKVVHKRAQGESLSRNDAQKRIDEILDKINRSGYDSLTKEEKEDWFKLSNKI